MITKLIQTEDYPIGDCFRTVMGCILQKEKPDDIPNFMKDGEELFYENLKRWLSENALEYIETEVNEYFLTNPYIPTGYCVLVGKSPRGEYDHAVVGIIKERGKKREVWFEHDTSPHHDGKYFDGDIKYVGFLTASL